MSWKYLYKNAIMRILWDKESVIEESKKYKTKTEFHKSKSGAYLYAIKHDLLKQMIWLKQPKTNYIFRQLYHL
jgi:hypothetical protein